MTTIATDGRSIAADGQQSIQGTIVGYSVVKVRKLDDGSLFGACGSVCDSTKFAVWLNTGAEGDPPTLNDDFGCIVVRPNGLAETCGKSGFLIGVDLPVAMGSGMDFAIGAMDAGASPEKAIEIACRRNPLSGGKITTIRLNQALRAAS